MRDFFNFRKSYKKKRLILASFSGNYFLVFARKAKFIIKNNDSISELLPPKEVGASCFIHRGYCHIFKELIKRLEAVFPQSPQAFPISLPDPTIGLSRPYVCSFFLFLGCFHLFIEDPKSLDQDIDRSVFITIMFCSTNRTDPGMNVQVLDFLVLVSADIT